MAYAERTHRPPTCLTEDEQSKILKVTGETSRSFRDHLLFALCLGTGLRQHEVLALNVGDVVNAEGRPRRRLTLRVFKRATREPAPQEVFLPSSLWYKLEKFLAWKQARGESLELTAPFFLSSRQRRLSARQFRNLFHEWQRDAGFDRLYGLHALRHSACTNLYRRTHDIRLVQRFARHKNLETTARYAGPTDEDLFRATDRLPC